MLTVCQNFMYTTFPFQSIYFSLKKKEKDKGKTPPFLYRKTEDQKGYLDQDHMSKKKQH